MDLTKIDSIETLESLAYRQIQALEVARANLQAIQTRIAQVQDAPKAK